jgi:polysaccharide deacetylase 2 family uncharacterized protein YibQ
VSWARASIKSHSRLPFDPKGRAFRFAVVVFLLALFWSANGCKKKEAGALTPAAIHSITKELADAARSASPPGTQIRTTLQASAKNAGATDHLDITLATSGQGSDTQSAIARIQQALGAVATRHGLTEEPSESREGILFFYLKGGVRTHAVHIHGGGPAGQAGNAGTQSGARLAIILDDLGSDRAAADAIFALPYPLTISVLPNHEHSYEIAEEAERRGYQVLMHLPMQSIGNEKPESRELHPGMPASEVSSLVGQLLQNVPGAVGVNNHQGSQATADPALMNELMPVLRERHLFYIDSRTTAATVAYDTAQSSGVPSAFRNVPFLDDVAEVGAVRKQLELALRDAHQKGQAIAIGHPHPATLEALREILPKAQSEGVELTFASNLVR